MQAAVPASSDVCPPQKDDTQAQKDDTQAQQNDSQAQKDDTEAQKNGTSSVSTGAVQASSDARPPSHAAVAAMASSDVPPSSDVPSCCADASESPAHPWDVATPTGNGCCDPCFSDGDEYFPEACAHGSHCGQCKVWETGQWRDCCVFQAQKHGTQAQKDDTGCARRGWLARQVWPEEENNN